jgi:hypothetical protein
MIRSSCLAAAVAFAALLAIPQAAQAQYAPMPPQVKPEQLKATGTIKAMRAGVLQVITDEGEPWLVQIRARPQDLSYAAAADTSYLKPGMLVRFVGTFNKRGQCLSPIGSLTIFTLREGYGVGIAPDSDASGGELNALFAEGKAEEKPADKKDDSAAFRVAGKLTKLSRTGEMTINAGGKAIKANLAEKATISVDTNDLSNLREGDKIELHGQYYPAQKGQAIATWVSVTAKEPLSDAKKKPRVEVPAAEKPATEEGAKPAEEKKAE